jgi:hypothetical protein
MKHGRFLSYRRDSGRVMLLFFEDNEMNQPGGIARDPQLAPEAIFRREVLRSPITCFPESR